MDDYPDAAKCLAILLKLDGYEAEVAYCGASALEAARARPPQAVLLDISMPSMDGFRVAQRLRALPGLADVVLIAITGYEGPGWRAHACEVGFTDYFLKPVEFDQLRRLLADHLDRQESPCRPLVVPVEGVP